MTRSQVRCRAITYQKQHKVKGDTVPQSCCSAACIPLFSLSVQEASLSLSVAEVGSLKGEAGRGDMTALTVDILLEQWQ